jgi:hypothetical protein
LWLLGPGAAAAADAGGIAAGGATQTEDEGSEAPTAEPREPVEGVAGAAPEAEVPAEEAPGGAAPEAAPDETAEEPSTGPPSPARNEPLRARERLESPLVDGPPTRGDFLHRLRATAENIERIRASERTEARTEDGVTVLSNVAREPSAAAPSATGAEVVDEPVAVAVSETASAANPPLEPVRDVDTSSRRRAAEADGRWHWLWVLGGLATILLVPIAMLLTRATRSG